MNSDRQIDSRTEIHKQKRNRYTDRKIVRQRMVNQYVKCKTLTDKSEFHKKA